MRDGMRATTLILGATFLLGTGVAIGIGVAPRLRSDTPASREAPAPAVARADRRGAEAEGRPAGTAPADERARLAAAAATLSQIPRLRAQTPPPPPAPSPRQRLAREELPPAVQQTVAGLTAGRKVQKPLFEARERDGQRYYKAEFQFDGVEHEYAIDEQGKVRFSEVDLEPSQLPSPVASGIQAALPGALLLEAERDQKDDEAPFYEVEVKHGGQQMELIVGEDGRLLDKRVR